MSKTEKDTRIVISNELNDELLKLEKELKGKGKKE